MYFLEIINPLRYGIAYNTRLDNFLEVAPMPVHQNLYITFVKSIEVRREPFLSNEMMGSRSHAGSYNMPQYPETDKIDDRGDHHSAYQLSYSSTYTALRHHDNGNDQSCKIESPAYHPKARDWNDEQSPRCKKTDPSSLNWRLGLRYIKFVLHRLPR